MQQATTFNKNTSRSIKAKTISQFSYLEHANVKKRKEIKTERKSQQWGHQAIQNQTHKHRLLVNKRLVRLKTKQTVK